MIEPIVEARGLAWRGAVGCGAARGGPSLGAMLGTLSDIAERHTSLASLRRDIGTSFGDVGTQLAQRYRVCVNAFGKIITTKNYLYH